MKTQRSSKTFIPIAVWTITAVALPIAVNAQEARTTRAEGKPMMMSAMSADKAIANWKAKPQEAARMLITKYGQPQEVTSMRLIWHNNGPWKCTEIVNEEIQHDFPKPHTDFLKQTVSMMVPPDKYDELGQYDGSVIVERTKGELSARCDKEENNILALNLAHEVAMGKKSAEEARMFFAETVKEMKHPEYTKALMFQPDRMAKGDPDMPVGSDRQQVREQDAKEKQ